MLPRKWETREKLQTAAFVIQWRMIRAAVYIWDEKGEWRLSAKECIGEVNAAYLP